jgi:hypothetical protein
MTAKNETQALVPLPVPEARRPGVVTVEDLMPVLDLAAAVRRRNFLVEVARSLMTQGVDYGVIPGTGSKPTLLKPGAERLCTLFGLSPELHEVASVEDWDGTGEGHGEPLFYYRYRVRLTKNGILLAEGDGSCSSRETKYRYRAGERKCPKCGKPAIVRGREEYGGGWLCFAKKGGCGAKFKAGDLAIEGQAAERTVNPDIADQVNTIQKMAVKRALIAAVLIATNASEFYTQDIEDLEVIDVPSAPPGPPEKPAAKPQPPPAKPDASARPWRSFKGMIDEFAKLHGRLGADYEHLYGETLQQFGVAHSNQFKDGDRAAACYRLLLGRVLQVEAAARDAEGMPAEDFDQPPEATA